MKYFITLTNKNIMNKVINNIKSSILLGVGLLMIGACSMYDLDINKDPNSPTVVNPNLLLANAQISCAGAFENVNQDCHDFVGVLASQGTDAFQLGNTSYNGLWSNFYANGMKDLESILVITAGDAKQKNMRGVAQAMKAFYYGMFVDLFGSVPFEEAFKGDDVAAPNTQPKFDTDKDVYEKLMVLCDSAIANLAIASFTPISNDIVYGNSRAKWTLLARTTKLKLIFNSRRVRAKSADELTALFAKTSDIIYAQADNFVWNYTTTASPADRRDRKSVV